MHYRRVFHGADTLKEQYGSVRAAMQSSTHTTVGKRPSPKCGVHQARTLQQEQGPCMQICAQGRAVGAWRLGTGSGVELSGENKKKEKKHRKKSHSSSSSSRGSQSSKGSKGPAPSAHRPKKSSASQADALAFRRKDVPSLFGSCFSSTHLASVRVFARRNTVSSWHHSMSPKAPFYVDARV